MTMKKRILCILLAAVLTLALAACGSSAAPAPAETAPPEAPADSTSFTSGGLTLNIPAEYAGQVIVETAEEPLFSVTEIISREAAKAAHPDNYEGAGWLFGITRVSEERLHQMLCEDMSGQTVFARDDSGTYYILNTPTDVRIERQGGITQADMDQWSALCAWAGQAGRAFAADNGLVPCRFGNTVPDMALARIAWGGDTDYALGGLAHGLLKPNGADGASFAAEILSHAFLEWVDRAEAPDGEYLYLLTSDGTRLEFFSGEGGCVIRELRGQYEAFYRAAEDVNVAEMVGRWYDALSENGTEAYDLAAYQEAVSRVLEEFSALDQNTLENFDEAAHPELPWYTAVIANTVRNSLYYGLYDFDNNFVPELVIAAGDDSWQQPMGIYAFDGEKMVYLCKEQALGERTTLTYFYDGLFAARGSGGAAVGSVTLWRIGPDGFSTEIQEIMDYEFQDEKTVVFTPQLGNISPEDFVLEDYMQDFDVPVDYTLFAPQGGQG